MHFLKTRPTSFQLYDSLRGLVQGVLEIGFSVFVLLIAIRWWEASSLYKGFLAGGMSLGLLVTPFFSSLLNRLKQTEIQVSSLLMIITGISLLLAGLTSSLILFVSLCMVAQICLSQIPNLILKAYTAIYSIEERGKKVSVTLALSTGGGLLASYAFGSYLDLSHADYRWILIWMSFSAFVAAFLLARMKASIPLSETDFVLEKHSGFRLLRKDRVFVRVLVAWMLLGFGAIMTFPLRVEYLSRENQMNLSNREIALVAVITFFGAKIISTFFWGKLFDLMHFIKLRVLLNIIMGLAILVYFNSETMSGVITGSILAGIGMGGANLAWNLWVTKLAPAGKEKDYMSIHMSFTGIRGFFAPFFGYWIEAKVGFDGVSIISALMISGSALLFLTCMMDRRFYVSKVQKQL